MEFQVKLTRSAEQQIESIYLWLKERNPEYANQLAYLLAIGILQPEPKARSLIFKTGAA